MSSLSLIRTLIFWNQGSSLVTSFSFNCFHKSSISKCSCIEGLGLEHIDMKGYKHSAHINCFLKTCLFLAVACQLCRVGLTLGAMNKA